MPRLVIKAQRVTFQWSMLRTPASDWPCTPPAHNDDTSPLGAA